jgi:hypothetical protein
MAAADQLEEGIAAEGRGILLIRVAAGDLEDPLAHEGGERVPHRPAPPIHQAARQAVAEAQGGIGLGEPGQAAIAGHMLGIETRADRLAMERGDPWERDDRLRHEAPSGMAGLGNPIIWTVLLIVNQPGE